MGTTWALPAAVEAVPLGWLIWAAASALGTLAVLTPMGATGDELFSPELGPLLPPPPPPPPFVEPDDPVPAGMFACGAWFPRKSPTDCSQSPSAKSLCAGCPAGCSADTGSTGADP